MDIWLCGKFFVLLASPKVLTFERTKKNEFSFGSLLTYSDLCRLNLNIIK